MKNQIPSRVNPANEVPTIVSSLTALGVRSCTLESATKKQIHQRGTITRSSSDSQEAVPRTNSILTSETPTQRNPPMIPNQLTHQTDNNKFTKVVNLWRSI